MPEKKILLIGAGRSSNTLISYLTSHLAAYQWALTVADADLALSQQKTQGTPAHALGLDISSETHLHEAVSKADIVISMLPAHMHIAVAKACLNFGKHLVTASYVSPEMAALDAEAKQQGLVFLNEIGLDPGLDHLSAMREIDKIRQAGGLMLNFESFAGGLLAPESEIDNPWRYKFTWNPRNVVMAGQGTVKFIQEGKFKYIPYHQLFRRTEMIEIEGYGRFEGYANRDSLKYLDVYQLRGIPTIYRGTLRRPGFCRAWNVFVQLGATDDSYIIENSADMTYREFLNSFLSYNPHDSVELKLMHYLKIEQDSDIMEKMQWLGIFEHTKIGLERATPAQILQHILEKKWSLSPDDRDMIVMWHQLVYKLENSVKKLHAWVVVKGDSPVETAMSKTVGLPLGIATKLILNGQISHAGVHIPTTPDIYEPILQELQQLGIAFKSREQLMEQGQVYM